MIIGWALGLLSVLIASFSQILLKKAAQKQQNNFIKKFLNVWVICGYILLFGSLSILLYCVNWNLNFCHVLQQLVFFGYCYFRAFFWERDHQRIKL